MWSVGRTEEYREYRVSERCSVHSVQWPGLQRSVAVHSCAGVTRVPCCRVSCGAVGVSVLRDSHLERSVAIGTFDSIPK